jgi:hypothetical protein
VNSTRVKQSYSDNQNQPNHQNEFSRDTGPTELPRQRSRPYARDGQRLRHQVVPTTRMLHTYVPVTSHRKAANLLIGPSRLRRRRHRGNKVHGGTRSK